MSERRPSVWSQAWRCAVRAADWLNGTAHAQAAEPLSRCAYDQMMAVMVK